jgi:hypothetical protein
MRKVMLVFSIAGPVILAVSGFTMSQPEKSQDAANPHSMTIQLSGGAEVPGPGDTDGSGAVVLTMNHEKGELCYDISVKEIEEPTAAHLHAGAAGKSGPPKITFTKGPDGAWKGCATADKALLNELMQKPGNFYVNVHNKEFPSGALRGQLGQ